MRQLLTGARIFTGETILDGHALLIGEGRILDILAPGRAAPAAETVRLEDGDLIAPGFIDIQVNGGGGVLFNGTPTAEGALAIAAAHRRFGTTAVLPTVITDTPECLQSAAEAAVAAVATPGGGVLGIHFEGPFIALERAGAHDRRFVRRPDEADLAFLGALPARMPGGRVLLTLAPECVEDEAICRLIAAGLILSVGHTMASAERVVEALDLGMRGVTHLFNAMPGIVNRQPGPAGAAMADGRPWCGLIVDGHHVHPLMLRAAVAARPRGRMMLVTDAMPPTGTDADSFLLNGRTIYRRDGKLVLADGTLAGADLDMAAAVRNVPALLGLPLEEGLRMASLYPAQFLGLEGERGRVAPGWRADLTLLGRDLTVRGTWVEGGWRAAG
ncbi:N-acetylglucosamine-6-phosphate deacetylase [Azospirillum thermophilum]|uniref:N-acetylglucosamine-6-phosphate deacetylase n=1 Tax=Azospirillum thermophilum TaxID=2202148 RepID=A0A2S2CYL8_9PROT|nr:N-acetylglucosamine-6-phosphate deacetylase [Azospirillum thermophilum]AWK89500.1 N-acetylglucosamine-6-phosphate deacetylase [Azospirillum thermophilum]